MAYLLREGVGKGVALYTRCEDELLAKAELLLLKERVEKDNQHNGKPIFGFIDVDPTFTVSNFKAAYRGNYAGYSQLMELKSQIMIDGWSYPETH